RDGSHLQVERIQRRADGRVQLTLGDQRSLVSLDDSSQFVQQINSLIASPKGVIWLSNLEPARYRALDESGRLEWPLGRDRDLFGQPLFDQWNQAIERALVVHAPAQVAYRWDGSKAKFLADISILPNRSPAGTDLALGSASCKVMLARNGQLSDAFQSVVLRHGDKPVSIDLDVTDAQLIVLLVDPADESTLGDHVLWQDARVVTAK
ncbi:MAG: NPCBM/NEW2 domain-containing protein, partial [Pirellulaceae bacterium]|nr:NPCBM/NEW2 domain-containing protein [Pirellulaceae bacterium]